MRFLQRLAILVRAGDWWIYKVSPIVATGVATSIVLGKSPVSMIATLALLLASISLVAVFASLINDICDIDEDRIAGKPNQMQGKTHLQITVFIAICLVAGALAISQFRQSRVAQFIYLSNWMVFAMYSIPPVRLKHRGLLGVIAMGLGECMLPHLFAVLIICQRAEKVIPIHWLLIVAIWTFAAGLRSILWHQLRDLDNDRLAGVRTLASTVSTQHLLIAGQWIIFPVEITSFAVILWLLHKPTLWILLALYFLTDFLRWKLWHTPVVIVSPSKQDRLLMFEYYDFFYMFGLTLAATRLDAHNIFLLTIVFLFYGRRLAWWFHDIYAMLRWEIPGVIFRSRKGNLNP